MYVYTIGSTSNPCPTFLTVRGSLQENVFIYQTVLQHYNTKYSGMLDEIPLQSYNSLLKNSKNENKTNRQ